MVALKSVVLFDAQQLLLVVQCESKLLLLHTATKNVLQEVRGVSRNIISTPYNKTVLREKLQVEFVCTYHRAIIKVPKKTVFNDFQFTYIAYGF